MRLELLSRICQGNWVGAGWDWSRGIKHQEVVIVIVLAAVPI